MFNLPIDAIGFSELEQFCNSSSKPKEGLDLDFKREWSDFAKVICGMANVQGGMVIVGVDEDKREPIWPPLGVEGTDESLYQRANSICMDGIYPPVFPEVKVCPLPYDSSRAVVVIRVQASNLMHAVDGRRRVYVRVGDQSRGFESQLASLSDIEWLFNRRQESSSLRETIIDRSKERGRTVLRYNYKTRPHL